MELSDEERQELQRRIDAAIDIAGISRKGDELGELLLAFQKGSKGLAKALRAPNREFLPGDKRALCGATGLPSWWFECLDRPLRALLADPPLPSTDERLTELAAEVAALRVQVEAVLSHVLPADSAARRRGAA